MEWMLPHHLCALGERYPWALALGMDARSVVVWVVAWRGSLGQGSQGGGNLGPWTAALSELRSPHGSSQDGVTPEPGDPPRIEDLEATRGRGVGREGQGVGGGGPGTGASAGCVLVRSYRWVGLHHSGQRPWAPSVSSARVTCSVLVFRGG